MIFSLTETKKKTVDRTEIKCFELIYRGGSFIDRIFVIKKKKYIYNLSRMSWTFFYIF